MRIAGRTNSISQAFQSLHNVMPRRGKKNLFLFFTENPALKALPTGEGHGFFHARKHHGLIFDHVLLTGEMGSTLHNRQARAALPTCGKDIREKVTARCSCYAGGRSEAALVKGLPAEHER